MREFTYTRFVVRSRSGVRGAGRVRRKEVGAMLSRRLGDFGAKLALDDGNGWD
jgi:hypothetical protein